MAWQLSIPDDENGLITGGEIGYVGVSKTAIRKYARLAAFDLLRAVVNGIKSCLKSISYKNIVGEDAQLINARVGSLSGGWQHGDGGPIYSAVGFGT